MDKEFVPYGIALELRDLGFDEPCFGRYGTTSKKLFTNRIFKNSEELCEDGVTFTNDLFAAPLYQQVFEWFREKHNIDAIILPFFNGGYGAECYKGGSLLPVEISCESYRQAQDACLNRLIEFLKEVKETL